MFIREVQRWRMLAGLARSCGFAELHHLAEELHIRRQEEGTALADYGYQTQLKVLIRLISQYGDCRLDGRQPEYGLLQALKRESKQLCMVKPKGLLRQVLDVLDASWPELLAIFGALLAEEAYRRFALQNYLYLQHLLHFFYTNRMSLRKEVGSKYTFVLDEEELWGLANSVLLRIGWHERVPVLRLEPGKFLLSPELLYDDLLQRYLELVVRYERDKAEHPCLRVAENS